MYGQILWLLEDSEHTPALGRKAERKSPKQKHNVAEQNSPKRVLTDVAHFSGLSTPPYVTFSKPLFFSCEQSLYSDYSRGTAVEVVASSCARRRARPMPAVRCESRTGQSCWLQFDGVGASFLWAEAAGMGVGFTSFRFSSAQKHSA